MNGEFKEFARQLRQLCPSQVDDYNKIHFDISVIATDMETMGNTTPAPGALPALPDGDVWSWSDDGKRLATHSDDQLRAYAEQCRAGVAELLAALREDMARPFSLILNYREQRRPNEPEGTAWWRWKRKQLEDAGYSMSHEFDNGEELFTRDGYTDRLTAALQSAFADDEGVNK